MTERDKLLSEIESFLELRGMPDSTFGRMAVNDGKFVPRIRSGGDINTRTLARVRAFMEQQKIAEAEEAQRLCRLVAAG
jgi:hypothetical protein